MEKIIIIYNPIVEIYLNELIDILFLKNYFILKENATSYVEDLIAFVENNIHSIQHKNTPQKITHFGNFYITYKTTILILLSILLFSSCKHDENSIEFTKFANLDLGNLSKESATLRADAIFMNHSQNAFNLKDITIDFSIDGKDVGTIVVKKDKVIQPNSEFTIPIKYEYATNSFLEPNHEPSGTYAVQLLGDINFTNENKEEQAAKIKYAMTYEYLTKKEIRIEKRETKKEERQKRREERKAKRQNN